MYSVQTYLEGSHDPNAFICHNNLDGPSFHYNLCHCPQVRLWEVGNSIRTLPPIANE
jgi:hypothetical protein